MARNININEVLEKRKYLCKDTIKICINNRKWIEAITNDKTNIRRFEDMIRLYSFILDEKLGYVITIIANEAEEKISSLSNNYKNIKEGVGYSNDNEGLQLWIEQELNIFIPTYNKVLLEDLYKEVKNRKDKEGRYLKQTILLCLDIKNPFLCNFLIERYL